MRGDDGERVTPHDFFSAEDAKPADVAVQMIALALIGDRRIEEPIRGWLADAESPSILRGQGRLALRLLNGDAVARPRSEVPIARLVRDAAFLNPLPMLNDYRRALETD